MMSGTFLIHGLYFAHNYDPDLDATKPTRGKTLFQYGGGDMQFDLANQVPQKWIRSANDNFIYRSYDQISELSMCWC